MKRLMIWIAYLSPLIFLSICGLLAWPIYQDFRAVGKEKETIQTKDFYTKFWHWARTEHLRIEEGNSKLNEGPMYFDQQPDFLKNEGCTYVYSIPGEIGAEFGGGFYHYGLRLKTEEESYTLIFYRDEEEPITLIETSEAETDALSNVTNAR